MTTFAEAPDVEGGQAACLIPEATLFLQGNAKTIL